MSLIKRKLEDSDIPSNDFDGSLKKIKVVSEDKYTKFLNNLPKVWDDDSIEKLFNLLADIKDESNKFIAILNKITKDVYVKFIFNIDIVSPPKNKKDNKGVNIKDNIKVNLFDFALYLSNYEVYNRIGYYFQITKNTVLCALNSKSAGPMQYLYPRIEENIKPCKILKFCVDLDNIGAFKYILESYPESLSSIDSGIPILHYVVSENKLKFFEILITLPILNINSVAEDDEITPLHIAAAKGCVEILKLILKFKDLDFDKCSKNSKMNVFHFASFHNKLDCLKLLISHVNRKVTNKVTNKVTLDYINSSSLKSKMTSMHFAATEGNIEIVKYLMKMGADILKPDINKNTALTYAAYKNREKVGFLMAKNVNSIKEKVKWLTMSCVNVNEKTILFELPRISILSNIATIIKTLGVKSKTENGFFIKRPLINVKFNNELGKGGGVIREFFNIIGTQYVKSYDFLFNKCNNDNYYNLVPVNDEKILKCYEKLGYMIALSIIHHQNVPIKFCKTVYKYLLKQPIVPDDLIYVDPTLHFNLNQIRSYEKDTIDDLNITFEDQEKLSNGIFNHSDDKTNVTKQNVEKYISHISMNRLLGNRKKSFDALYKGFYSVLPEIVINQIFTVEELELLVVGNYNFDMEDWKNNVIYHNCDKDTDIVKWLWEILDENDNSYRSKFLEFSTSYKYVRTSFKDMDIKFSIRITNDSKLLPTSTTCSNMINIPKYESKEILKYNINESLRLLEYSGFGFV